MSKWMPVVKCYTVRQTANQLGITCAQVYQLNNAGQLGYHIAPYGRRLITDIDIRNYRQQAPA